MRGNISWRAVLVFALAVATMFALPAGAASLTWDNNGSDTGQTDGAGTWLDADMWWDGAANATWNNSAPDDAIIGSGGAGGTITLGTVIAGSVLLDNFTGTYTLSGGSLDQSGGITIGTTAGNVTISSPVSGTGGITKTGAGRLTLSSTSSSYSGQLSIEDGELYATSINNNGANGVLGNSALPVILGASGQTGRLRIQKDGGISSNKDFTLATGGTGEIWFDNLSGGITNAFRALTLSGTISGSGNFVNSGRAPVILQGNNNYTGTTTVTGGPLRLNNANALPGGIGVTGGTSALTINGVGGGATIDLTTASGEFRRGLGTGIDQFQIPGGISGFSAAVGARQVIVNDDPDFELEWGIPTFNPSELLFNYHSVSSNNPLTLQNKIDLAGATRTVRVNANTATISNDIRTSSGTAGLTKTGNGTLVLSGNNTYNGPTTISAGTLSVDAPANLGSGGDLVFDGGALQLTSATPMTLSGHTIASNPGKIVTFNISGSGSLVIDGDNTYLGSTTISAGTLELGVGGTSGTLSAAPLLNNGTLIVNRSDTVTQGTTFPSIIAGTGSVTNAGSGTLVLNVANTYAGLTTASAGTITLSDARAIQNSALDTAGAGAVSLDTGITTPTFGGLTGAVDLGTGGALATGYSGVTALTLNPQSGVTFTYGGVIANGSGDMTLTKTGAGTQALEGLNTYTGATTLKDGTLDLSGGGTILTTSGITLSGGGLKLTNTAAETGSGRVADGTGITSNGGTITYTNTSGADTYAETLGPVALTAGQLNVVESVNQTGAGSQTLTLSGLTHPGSTSAVAFSAASTTPDATKNMIVVSGAAETTAGQIIGPWATVGTAANAQTDYAVYNGSSQVVGADIAASTEDTWTTPANAYTLSAGTALTGTRTITALRYTGTTGTLDLGANNLETFGILNGGTNTLTISSTGGVIRQQDTAAANLYVTTGAKAITISAPIEDNTGALTLVKSGTGGTLTLSGTNSYSGGTVINAGGTVTVTADNNLGAADTAITFDGSATLWNEQGGNTTIDLGARPITLNNGAIATFRLGRGDGFTTTGAVTGNGGVAIQVSGGNSPKIYLLSTNNTFTGPVEIRSGSDRPYVTVNSLADGSGAITLNNSGGHFVYGSGATGPLTLNNRPIVVQGGGSIDNGSSFAMTINTDLLVSGTGNKTLGLSGTAAQGNQFAGDIADGTGVVGLTLDDWSLSGTNTYSGQTYASGGTTVFQGSQALSPSSTVLLSEYSSNFKILDDGSGTINLGNTVTTRSQQTSAGATYKIFVGNNSTANGGSDPASTTTGSTIALGKFSYATVTDNRANGLTLNVYGANDYRLQIGDVELNVIQRGNQMFNPTTAPLTITGTVKQVNGKAAGANTGCDTLVLKGTATGNLVSGTIMDADDYTDLSNPNAVPLNVTKSDAGEWTLTGTNTYSGVTTVTGGTLGVTGSCDYSDVTVSNNNTRITGGGSVKGLAINANAGFIWGYGDSGDHTMDITGGDLVLNDDWVLKLMDLGNDPLAGEQYDLFTYSGSCTLGTFTVDATEALDWDLTNLSVVGDAGRLYITGIGVPGVAGDADGDGDVDAADYIALKTNMGQPTGATTADGDFDGDGDVDWDDLQILQDNYGKTIPGASGTIPEPATLGLLAIGAMAVIRRRRRS